LACATFVLDVGGLIGSPIASRLIKKHNLKPVNDTQQSLNDLSEKHESSSSIHRLTLKDMIGTIFSLGLCLGLGDALNRYLFTHDIKLPGFLSAMLVGIILTNSAERAKIQFNQDAIDLISPLSLQLFLTLSLMSMDLMSIMGSASYLLIVVLAQSLIISSHHFSPHGKRL